MTNAPARAQGPAPRHEAAGSRPAGSRPASDAVRGLAPGVGLAAVAASLALGVHALLPAASPLLLAILAGAVVVNLGVLPTAAEAGLVWSGRHLLRAGVVLLGLQLSLGEVAALGPGVVVLVIAVVAGGIAGTMWLGRLLGLGWTERLLIACGFSICGAAAVAAVDGVLDDEPGREEGAATAVGLVVVFGTLMIGVVPAVVGLLGLDPRTGGLWAGASIHEVAQVVAAGGAVGGGALAVAVVVKLARVLLLAPVLGWVGWRRRTRLRAAGTAYDGKLPPLVPGFVLAFCAMVVVGSWAPVPDVARAVAETAESALLAAAMFALGCGVRAALLRRWGMTPLVLAAAATGWVATIGLVGALLVG